MKIGKYYLTKLQKHQYSAELQECIKNTCKYCIDMTFPMNKDSELEKEKSPIMMLGKIQSGKTRAYIGLMALAFDNNFDMIFILTKSSKALVQQTRKRMYNEFKSEITDNEIEIFDIMKVFDALVECELDKKIIIVAKKEKNNLDRISKFISDYTIQQRKNCLIIDDEADATGIGYCKTKNSANDFDLRTVASKINIIRGNLEGCVFVQVTATPYALYLQPEFEENNPAPIKPKKTTLVPSGDGYIGGEYYFIESKDDNHPSRYIFEPVTEEENDLISIQKRKGKKSRIEDRRRFKEEDVLIRQDKLIVFKKGIINFIIGGCVLRKTNTKIFYSYVIHTATQKSSHLKLENILNEFIKQIKNRNTETMPIINKLIQESYSDIKKSTEAYGYTMPTLDDISTCFYNAVDKGLIIICSINSDKDIEAHLDEESGQLKLRAPFSIFVGGQTLDRGVTIHNMIGFHYGRNPKTMQQDTVMQHSRMFGYRDNKLLSVTRFYTTKRIYENMTRITEIDMSLREDIEKGKFSEGIYFLQKHVSNRVDANGNINKDVIAPCSPSKIALSNIVMLRPGSRILPVGFTPVSKSLAKSISKDINKRLKAMIGECSKDTIIVSLDELEPIINLIYSAIRPDDASARFVPAGRFLTTIKYLAKDKKVYLIVREEREAGKYKDNGTAYQDAPDTSQDELSVARKVAIDTPALILLHQNGNGSGWNGCEFWWPVLVCQKHIDNIIFSMEEPSGNLKCKI